MGLRFYDHFQCWTSLTPAQTWDAIHNAILDRTLRVNKPGFYGIYDAQAGIFRLQYQVAPPAVRLNRRLPYSELTVRLTPSQVGCEVEAEIRLSKGIKLFAALWMAFMTLIVLSSFISEPGEGLRSFHPDMTLWIELAVLVGGGLMFASAMNQSISEGSDALQNLIGARDVRQLPRQKKS